MANTSNIVDTKYGTNAFIVNSPTFVYNSSTEQWEPYVDGDKTKMPVYVAIKNKSEMHIPSHSDSAQSPFGNPDPDLSTMFGIHIYDKVFSFYDIIYVAPLENSPHMGDGSHETFDYNGVLSGYIQNGISGDKITADIDGKSIEYHTIDDDTIKNPHTLRLLYSNNDGSETQPYGTYKKEVSFDNDYQYLVPENRDCELSASDGYGDNPFITCSLNNHVSRFRYELYEDDDNKRILKLTNYGSISKMYSFQLFGNLENTSYCVHLYERHKITTTNSNISIDLGSDYVCEINDDTINNIRITKHTYNSSDNSVHFLCVEHYIFRNVYNAMVSNGLKFIDFSHTIGNITINPTDDNFLEKCLLIMAGGASVYHAISNDNTKYYSRTFGIGELITVYTYYQLDNSYIKPNGTTMINGIGYQAVFNDGQAQADLVKIVFNRYKDVSINNDDCTVSLECGVDINFSKNEASSEGWNKSDIITINDSKYYYTLSDFKNITIVENKIPAYSENGIKYAKHYYLPIERRFNLRTLTRKFTKVNTTNDSHYYGYASRLTSASIMQTNIGGGYVLPNLPYPQETDTSIFELFNYDIPNYGNKICEYSITDGVLEYTIPNVFHNTYVFTVGCEWDGNRAMPQRYSYSHKICMEIPALYLNGETLIITGQTGWNDNVHSNDYIKNYPFTIISYVNEDGTYVECDRCEFIYGQLTTYSDDTISFKYYEIPFTNSAAVPPSDNLDANRYDIIDYTGLTIKNVKITDLPSSNE